MTWTTHTHICPARRCDAEVPDNRLMCRGHWALVPTALQRAVYAAYDHKRGIGSLALMNAQTAAIRAANARLGYATPEE